VRLKNYVRGCVSLKKYKSQGKAVEVTVNSKEELFELLLYLSKNSASGRTGTNGTDVVLMMPPQEAKTCEHTVQFKL
jgi:hypothetical protein